MTNKPSRIFLNDNIPNHLVQRGVSRYFNHIVDGVIAHYGNNTIICSPQDRDYGPAKHIQSYRLGGRRFLVHDLIASITAYRESPAIFFSAYFGNAKVGVPEAFTIYDMIFELHPIFFPQQSYSVKKLIADKKRCIERASVVFTISNSTAQDLKSYYTHINPDKIVTTHLGIDDFFFKYNKQKSDKVDAPFFLYVGSRFLYKNFINLLIAYGESGLARDFDLRVISPIGHGFSQQEMDYIAKYKLENNVYLLTGVSDVVLRENYANAIAFVYPSLYEGFGLPILEAMAGGTLVATSHVSSMPEIGGDVAFYFNPNDIESMVDVLHQIAYLPDVQRKNRIAQGIAWAKTFTWKRCQKQTIEVIQQFL